MPRAPRTKKKRSHFLSVLIPGSTGSAYLLIPGALGFFAVLWVFLDSYLACRNAVGCTVPIAPPITGEMLTAVVTMLGVHAVRATFADKRNADNGVTPVPYEEGVSTVEPTAGGSPNADMPYEEPPLPPDPPAPKTKRRIRP